jgi:hypothetical protein
MEHWCFLPLKHWWHQNKITLNIVVETWESPIPLSSEQVLEQSEIFVQVKFGMA